MEKVENAKENDDQGVLDNSLKDIVNSTCKVTFLSSNNDQTLHEWVIFAKNQITEILKSNSSDWWKEMTESKGRAAKVKGNPDLGLILLVKPIVCEINEFLRGGLVAAETKERDNAAKKIMNVIEIAADMTCKNEVVKERITSQIGHLIAQVYKNEYKICQTQLKLVETQEYLGNESDFRAQSKSLYYNSKRIFAEQKPTFPMNTRVTLMGQTRKRSHLH